MIARGPRDDRGPFVLVACCTRRVRRLLACISSLRGAKRRSNPDFLRRSSLDCFASLAMTRWLVRLRVHVPFRATTDPLPSVKEQRARLRLLAARMPEGCVDMRPSDREGAGSTACSSHPQPCVQVKKARKQVTTGTPKQSGAPCTMVYGLFRALPGVPGLDSLRRPSISACWARRADIASRRT
jgi:hypothetical protein